MDVKYVRNTAETELPRYDVVRRREDGALTSPLRSLITRLPSDKYNTQFSNTIYIHAHNNVSYN
jgi:hypothetical protein